MGSCFHLNNQVIPIMNLAMYTVVILCVDPDYRISGLSETKENLLFTYSNPNRKPAPNGLRSWTGHMECAPHLWASEIAIADCKLGVAWHLGRVWVGQRLSEVLVSARKGVGSACHCPEKQTHRPLQAIVQEAQSFSGSQLQML